MEAIKFLLKKIINRSLFKMFIIYLLRNKLISKRFKNLIELDGMHYIYKTKIKVYNDKKDAVTRDLCIFGIPKKEKEIFDKFIFEVRNAIDLSHMDHIRLRLLKYQLIGILIVSCLLH